MSDSDKTPPKPPVPMKKTSAVPLKKETVRVTLKAKPGAPAAPPSAPVAPPKPPSAPAAPSAPKAPSAPSAPKAPAAAAAPKPPSAPAAPKAPSAPKPPSAPAAPKAPAPAPTIALKTPGAPAAGGPPAPAPTIALKTPGTPSPSLGAPKTAALPQATQPIGNTAAASTPEVQIGSFDDDDDFKEEGKGAAILAGVAAAFALGVLVLQFLAHKELTGETLPF